MVIIILLIDIYLIYKIAKNDFSSNEIDEINDKKISVGNFGFSQAQRLGYYIILVAFTIFSFFFMNAANMMKGYKEIYDFIAMIIILIPWISISTSIFFMKRQYIVLTNNRIIGKYRVGVFSTNVVNLTLDKMSNITVQNRIAAKNILLSAGGIDKIIFQNILNSEEFKESVNKEIDNYKIVVNSSPKQENTSTADEILKLKDLLDQGILTQEEFDNKKKQLLSL